MPLKEPLSAIHSTWRFIFKSQFYFYKDKRCVSIKAGLVEFCTICVCLWYSIPYNFIPSCPQLILDLYSQVNQSYVSGSKKRLMIGMTCNRYASQALGKGRPFQSLHKCCWNLTKSARSGDRIARNGEKPAEHIQSSFCTTWKEESFYLPSKYVWSKHIPSGILLVLLKSTYSLYACALIFYRIEIETALSI